MSVSQNAMSAFERRGLPFRDVFDSSFDVIVELGYLDLPAAKRLLQRRAIGMSVPFLCVCHSLSGGLPRDLIRVARELLELGRADQVGKELPDLVRALLADELDRKQRAVAVAAAKVKLEPWTGRFLAAMEATRTAAEPGALLIAARTLAKDESGYRNQTEESLVASSQLARLRGELASYYYYCATLAEYFSAGLTEERLRAAEEARQDAPGSVDQLARARQAFAVSPQIAWGAASSFRQASGMKPFPFPDAVLPAAEAPTQDGPATVPTPGPAQTGAN